MNDNTDATLSPFDCISFDGGTFELHGINTNDVYFDEEEIDALRCRLRQLNEAFNRSALHREGWNDHPFSITINRASLQIHFDGRQILASGLELSTLGSDPEKIEEAALATLRALALVFDPDNREIF